MFTVFIILSCLIAVLITFVSICIDDPDHRTGWILTASALLLVFGGFAGAIASRESIQKEAAAAGAGQYQSTTDKLTGRVETEFIWTPKQQPAAKQLNPKEPSE